MRLFMDVRTKVDGPTSEAVGPGVPGGPRKPGSARGEIVAGYGRLKNIRALIPVGVALLTVLVAAVPALAEGGGETVANVRDATAAYHDSAAALAAGYELLTDAANIACIDQPGEGTMGIHFVKGALVQGGAVDAARPQALVYERQDNGQLELAAVEYVVIRAAWDDANSAPPSLFGQKFMITPAGNRYGLPAFYSLHAWIWTENPKGTFSMWNPSVACAANSGSDTGDNMDQMQMDR